MSIKALNPYLHFEGNAQQALELYSSALGAEAAHVMRYADGPMADNMPAEAKNLIMHAEVRIDGHILLMSDDAPGCPPRAGGNGEILLDFSDVAALDKAFDALAAGGTVVMKPENTFWGARFGVLTDKFGVRWALHCMLPRGPQ